jgi:hypothetical protein
MSHRPAPTRDVFENARSGTLHAMTCCIIHPSARTAATAPLSAKTTTWSTMKSSIPNLDSMSALAKASQLQSYQRKYTLVSLEQDRARLLMQAKMLFTGVVFALGMVIAGVSVTHEATAAEATEEVTKPQPLINRYEPPPSEAEPRISDREQLKRYFLQGERGWPRR